MKIKTVTVSLGITVNVGDYQSERHDIEIAADLDKTDNPQNVHEHLTMEAQRLIALQLVQVLSGPDNERLVKLALSLGTSERKRESLKRRPEYVWIERLYPMYAEGLLQSLDYYIVRGAKIPDVPSIPDMPDKSDGPYNGGNPVDDDGS